MRLPLSIQDENGRGEILVYDADDSFIMAVCDEKTAYELVTIINEREN
jgi:hypothetical protein